MNSCKYKRIKNKIENYNLKPATQRDLSLLSASCMSHGYTYLLRKKAGLSYEALAFIGKEGKFHSMLDEKSITEKTENFLRKNKKIKKLVFKKAISTFRKINSKIENLEKISGNNPRRYLRIIINFYPEYASVLGLYNCFWRYIGNNPNKSNLSKGLIKKISNERNMVAELYPRIEELILRNCKALGKKEKFDGYLLRHFTFEEINKTLESDNKITPKSLREVKLRKKSYFYLFIEGEKEEIMTDKIIINKIKEQFFKIDNESIGVIKGFSAYRGKAKGRVFNTTISKNLVSKKYILVAPSTHPKDIKMIKDSLAIVTDEGGILSHAAIISREIGIPCIIGTKIATQVLKDGDLVEVDADKGIVKVIKKK